MGALSASGLSRDAEPSGRPSGRKFSAQPRKLSRTRPLYREHHVHYALDLNNAVVSLGEPLVDLANLHMATSHSKVKGWPGDRVPGLDDAEFAHRPLDATTINSVLESIRVTQNPAQTTRYLQPGQDNPLQPARNETPSVSKCRLNAPARHTHTEMQVQWPSCLVSVLDSELEAEIATIDIPKLVSICYHQFIPRVPFLRDLPSRTAFEQPKSVYVNLAMASIGGIIAKEPISKCVSLWRSAIRLIIWQLEVDNREARKIDLISAVSLLFLYHAITKHWT